jgi:hypothetical protein
MIEGWIIISVVVTIFFILLGALVLLTDRDMVIGILFLLIGADIALFTAGGVWAIGGWVIVAVVGSVVAYVSLDYFGII